MTSFSQTPRTTFGRRAGRASYDRDTIYAILDEGIVCHVAFSLDDGPRCVPMIYGRSDDHLYLHGSGASAVLAAMDEGIEACVNVTLTDGIVLARSGYNHSIRYRSVTLYGVATKVVGDARLDALRVLTEHTIPGRWVDLPEPTEWELGETTVMSLPIAEVSAKVMDEWAHDVDAGPGIWAGLIPLALEAKAPIDHPDLATGIGPPDYVTHYRRPNA